MKCVIALDHNCTDESYKGQYESLAGMISSMIEDVQFIELDPAKILQLPNNTDLCVVDFGGLCGGYNQVGALMCRDLVKTIEDRPSTLFMIWSSHSSYYFKETILEALSDELGRSVYDDDFKCPNNVQMYPERMSGWDVAWERAINWCKGIT